MKNYFFTALCALALIGCTQEPATPTLEQEEIGGETGYMAFRIKSANTGGMTRAWLDDDNDDYDKGAGEVDHGKYSFADEDAVVNNIQANRVFFFDSEGNYHSSSLLSLTKTTETDNSHVDDDLHSSDYPEQTWAATVKRTSERGKDQWPEQCLVVLNGRPSRLNALLLRAQADESFKMKDFLAWVNEDFRDGDVVGEGETLGLYKYQDKYYFTMTNSVFIQKEGEQLDATQILGEHLYPTSAEAAENPITVYVERVVSKVEVGFINYKGADGSTPKYFSDDDKYIVYEFTSEHDQFGNWLDGGEQDDSKAEHIPLKALVCNWTINAVEYQTMLFKNLSDDFVDSNDGATDYPFLGWNDYKHHRSYWAVDNHYVWDTNLYPTQYRTAFDGKATSYQDETEGGWEYGKETAEEGGNDIMSPGYPWALDYKSYNAITNHRKWKYCLENTFELPEGDGKDSYLYMIMGSHLLVQARLITEDEEKALTTGDKADLDKNIGDKYYYSDRYYDEVTYINRQVGILNELLGEEIIEDLTIKAVTMYPDTTKGDLKLGSQSGGLWVKDDDGTFKRVIAEMRPKSEGEQEYGKYEIAATKVFGIAPAYVLKGDGKVTIALRGKDKNGFAYGEGEEVNLYYYTKAGLNEDGSYINKPEEGYEMVQLTRNQVISLIYGMTNVADCFKMGCMYYAVPIQHFIAAGTDMEVSEGKYNAKYIDIETGDYGIVRNHWYKFTIDAIAKPGIPVHDPDQPIIPNYDEEDRYIGLQVVIIPWHIVNNGNVTLGN